MLNYIKESYNELVNKVTWPTFPQLQSSTIVVMVASVSYTHLDVYKRQIRTFVPLKQSIKTQTTK